MALDKLVTKRMIEKNNQLLGFSKENHSSYFKHVGATVKTKVSGQIVTIKQERALLSRFLVAVKSRNDFVIKKDIGDFKFNVVAISNFHPDGSMIMQSDKAHVVFLISNMPLPDG